MSSPSEDSLHSTWDAQMMFDVYLHDYFVKRKMDKTAEFFRKDVNVHHGSVALDTPDGFLHEWWETFYDMYSDREQMHRANKGKAPIKDREETQINNELQVMRPILPRLPVNHRQRDAGSVIPFPAIGTDSGDMMLRQRPTSILPARMFGNHEQHSTRNPVRNFNSNALLIDQLNLLNSSAPFPTSHNHTQQQQLYNQAQQIMSRDNRNFICSGGGNLMETTVYNQSMGPGVSPASQNAWLLRQLLHQVPNQPQRFPIVLTGESQPAMVSHSLQLRPGNLTSPRSSPNFDTHQRPTLPASNVDQTNRKRKKGSNVRPQDNNLANAEFDKPEDVNVELFLSADGDNDDNRGTPLGTLKRSSTGGNKNDQKDFCFQEVACLNPGKNKVVCCHFSTDGKVLASAGHDKKVSIWNMEKFEFTESSEGHALITDIRFRSNSTIFATSSFDRTLQIWDADKPCKPLLGLLGHTEHVMSLDFHPRKADLLCSCDSNDVIRLWNINECSWIRTSEGATRRVRFQPQSGKLLATASGNCINIIDVETDRIQFSFKGHSKEVRSICWDATGKYIASVSEDSARLWLVESCGNGNINELNVIGKKFESCTFHPAYSTLLVIGGYQSLEFWNPVEGNKTWSVPAHNGLIASLANSPKTEMIASASHDHLVKVWK